MSDLIIVLIVIGIFAFCIWKKKKKQETESEKVQTSELSALPQITDTTSLSSVGNGMFTSYPKGAMIDVLAFNFRDFHNMEQLELNIHTKLNRLLLDVSAEEFPPMFQYIPIGTTLLILCVHM